MGQSQPQRSYKKSSYKKKKSVVNGIHVLIFERSSQTDSYVIEHSESDAQEFPTPKKILKGQILCRIVRVASFKLK